MHNSLKLAAELKKGQADCREKTTINMVNNFESGEDDDSLDSDCELVVNIIELIIAEQCTSQVRGT